MEGEPHPGSFPALVVSLFAATLILSAVGYGQLTNATLVGSVQDPGGAVLVGANVAVRNVGTNQIRTDVTNAEGLYRITDLPPGTYEVKAEKQGFKTTLASGIVLHVGQTSRVDMTMQVGTFEQKVEVSAATVLVNTEEAGITNIVEQKQVEELPLVRRNIYQLPVMEPGTQPTRILMPTYYNNSVYDLGFVSYGKNIRSSNFMLDGAPNNDNGLGGIPGIAPILDAVQEFQVSTNDFGREFGRNFGAVVNVATKSGTNQIHGSAWEFHRNAAVNASNFFDPGRPSALIQNEFGFTLGGPIRKDKMFWFMAYEGFRERRGVTRRVQVETPQLRAFVAAQDALAGAQSVAGYLFQHFPGPPTVPATEVSLGIQPANGPCGPNPCPDVGIGTGQAVNSTTTDQYDLRFDDFFHGGNDRLFVRWAGHYPRSTGVGELTTIGGLGRIIRGFRRPSDGSIGNLAVGYTHIFNPALVNDFRFGYMRNQASTDAFPSNAPDFFMNDLTLGFGSDFFIPINFTNNAFNFKDNVLVTSGKHGMKMGVEYNHDLESSTFDVASRGVYVFANLPGFVANSPLAYEVHIDPQANVSIINSPNRFRHFRRRDFAWFFQDDWKVRKNLTINAGLRWEYFGVITETNGKQAGLTLGSGATIQEQLIGATVGKLGQLYKPNYRNYGPLLGFAWDPKGNGRFSVRGGWAINYDRIHSDLLSEPARFTPPFGAFALAAPGLTNPSCSLPAYTPASVFQFPPSIPAGFTSGLNSNGFLDPSVGCVLAEVMAIDQKLRTPYVEQWNFTLQYELVNDWLLELSYAGNQGHRLSFTNDPNRVTAGAPPAVPCFVGGVPLGARPNCLLAEPLLSTLDYLSTTGLANYNSGSVQVKKRFTHGYLLQASYTFGKALDIQDDANAGDFIGSGTGYNGTQDAANPRGDYGRSSFDIRHRVTANGVWEIGKLPKQSALVRNLLGGWQINTIVSYESGRPFTVYNSVVDYNGDGGGAAQAPPTGNAYDRPNIGPTFGNSVGCRSPHDYVNGLFQSGANVPGTVFGFIMPTSGTDGNLGRNTFCGPNFKSVDFSLVRNFPAPFMGERGKIQFRVEAFNMFNRVNLYLPDSDLGALSLRAGLSSAFSTFGKSTQAYTPRELQFGLKLSW
jgi:Carboxypeptidase regulatory-like domain/TonB dependent receptor-like, beta-barrel